ncbi:MAG: NifU family protein [Bellilinea sp.]
MVDEIPEYSINDQLRGLVEQLSAYIETYHGGEVEFIDFDGKIVTVKLGGACLGCPLSPVTVKGWVEGTVKQFFPEVEGVKAIE